ncbi:MAG TPA: HAMP domain-containing sensor histidine kinase [Acidimicrobiales bacterium]|nr:HAMP domain-containing sensor histidine kinase [Acidimicrobiales bacterium]
MTGRVPGVASLLRRRPELRHATRVAAAAAVVIAVLFSALSVTFDLVDGGHLLSTVDGRLRDRLAVAAIDQSNPTASERGDSDIDAAPIFLWRAGREGAPAPLELGAPRLPEGAWSPSGHPVTARLGHGSFRLLAVRTAGGWLVAGQSLAESNHIEGVLAAVETIGGSIFVVAVFFGALAIGLKASRPIEEARRRQLEFTADASHELRTPLSVIEAEVSLALCSPGDHAWRQTFERVREESGRLRRIVEDLLWLARFDSGPPIPREELVDLVTLAEGCAERFAALARSYRVELALRHEAPGPLCVRAAPEDLDRLLGVLVDNACRYAGEGGRVQLGVLGARGGRIALVVEDNGPGIPPGERHRLFDRFHRGTDIGSGAGLGLAIADSVVRATGGRWSVGDSPLGGARMEVSWHAVEMRDRGPVREDRATETPTAAGPL